MEVKGIIIKSLDYKESSKIAYLYTSKGNLSVMVKGAKKLKSGFLPFITTLNFVNAIVSDKQLPILIDYNVIDDFNDLKEDLKINLWFSYLLELVYKLPSDANHEKCFAYVLRIINNIRKQINIILLITIFQLKLTYLFGVAPNFKSKEVGKYFSIKNGIYQNSKPGNLSEDDSKTFERLYYFNDLTDDFKSFDNIDIQKFFKLVNEYYSYHVDIKIKGLGSIIY